MANLYLIDKPFGGNGLELAAKDDEAIVVLIQDGVYLDPAPILAQEKQVFAMKRDLAKRGRGNASNFVKAIDYSDLVDLIVEHKVVNFA